MIIFDDFKSEIKLFKKISSGNMKPEEAKKYWKVFKSNQNKLVIGRLK